MMKLAWTLLAILPVCAQTLRLSAVEGTRGDVVKVEILLDAPASQLPSVLKWETTFPAQVLEAAGNAPEISAPARDAGKTLQCSQRKPYVFACILSGGQAPLPNGLVAVFHFKIRTNADLGTSAIRIEGAEGVTADLRRLAFKDAEAPVRVR